MEHELIFGDGELKTVGKQHSQLEGWQEIARSYPQETITDRFHVLEKTGTEEDGEGNCYDWYRIEDHYRVVDSTGPIRKAQEDTDALIVDQEFRLTQLELGI